MKQNSQEAIDYIKTIEGISDDEKKRFVSMIENGDDPIEVLEKVQDIIQDKMDDVFQGANITLDENDPEYQSKHKEMMSEIQSAEDEFDNEIEIVNQEATKIQDNASQEMDNVKVEAIKSKMTE